MQLKTNPTNPTPNVGELLYNEYLNDEGSIHHTSLIFIDTPPDDQQQWLVTWVAMQEDFSGKGPEVYIEPEAGGIPPQYTRKATDADIQSFVDVALAEGAQGQQKLKNWLELIASSEDYQPLLPAEKQRLERIIRAGLE